VTALERLPAHGKKNEVARPTPLYTVRTKATGDCRLPSFEGVGEIFHHMNEPGTAPRCRRSAHTARASRQAPDGLRPRSSWRSSRVERCNARLRWTQSMAMLKRRAGNSFVDGSVKHRADGDKQFAAAPPARPASTSAGHRAPSTGRGRKARWAPARSTEARPRENCNTRLARGRAEHDESRGRLQDRREMPRPRAACPTDKWRRFPAPNRRWCDLERPFFLRGAAAMAPLSCYRGGSPGP